MKIKVCLTQEEFEELFEWQPWFAWHPIFVNGHIIWLTKVNRKLIPDFGEYYWQYEEITNEN